MESKLFCMVYTSSASELFDDEALQSLLNVARKNNKQQDVTGMLLYSEGVFMQALEGEKQSVEQLYNMIAKDPRHYGVIILNQSFIESRQFSQWQMGFKVASRQELVESSSFTDFLNPDFDIRQLQKQPSIAMKLLLSFRKNM
ncbi:BLUF domain-containing protein [Endozoicomonas arenosclerae]|uniref:BLUF domain-containing protein n=1 Tax=Endozoicomonas arenosclerae TaxID=1633495 RepID=UPI0007842AAB|nr:BLUF domain-containing protein [Endozoicomonas arenosclerae]